MFLTLLTFLRRYLDIGWHFWVSLILVGLGGCTLSKSFAPVTPLSLQVTLTEVRATQQTLTLVFRIVGWPQIYSRQEVLDLVCRPYLHTREHVPLTFSTVRVEGWEEDARSFVLRYQYRFGSIPPPTLHLNAIELVIGPCAPALSESNTTPQLVPILADYHTQATIQVKGP